MIHRKYSFRLAATRFFLALSVCIGFILFGTKPLQAREKIVLQLSWKHQFQFAGYYAALEKGYYSEAGFDVEIREATENLSVVEEILNGNAQFAVGDAELLVYFTNGDPIVILACIFQHSPSVLLVKSSSGIKTPQDLVGKTLMVGEDLNGLEILTMLYSEGLKKGQFTIVPQSFSVNELLTDKVDALGAYISNEPFFMEKFGIPHQIIFPTTYGVDFYSDCLYTTRKLFRSKPERVKKFREASIRGWEYALENPEEIAHLIISKYNSSKTIDHLVYEAKVIKTLINPEFIEVGHINSWRWQKIAEYLYQHGVTNKIPSIDNFLYNSNASNSALWLKIIISTVAIALILGALIILIHFRLSLTIEKRTKRLNNLVKQLEEQNAESKRINFDLIRNQEIAKESEEKRFQFITKLINELRVPIISLIDLTEQLCKPNISGEKKQAVSSRIVYHSKLINEFVNDITAISNIESDNKSSAYKRINIKSFLESNLNEVRKNFSSSNTYSISLNLSYLLQNDEQEIFVDIDKMQRVIAKFVSNAIKFTESGFIEIGCEQDSPISIVFWIKDSGVGVEPDLASRINTFFSESTRNNNSDIVGLGLWVCKNLVQQMRGSIWIDTNYNLENEERKGCKFIFKIPAIYVDKISYDHPQSQLSIKHSLASLSRIKDKNILVFDKHFANYNLIKILLKGTGCILYYAENVLDTSSILRGYREIDMVILNAVNLSAETQYAAAQIKKIKPSLPILAHVTYEVSDKTPFSALGFIDVIQINANPDKLLYLIAKNLLD